MYTYYDVLYDFIYVVKDCVISQVGAFALIYVIMFLSCSLYVLMELKEGGDCL